MSTKRRNTCDSCSYCCLGDLQAHPYFEIHLNVIQEASFAMLSCCDEFGFQRGCSQSVCAAWRHGNRSVT